MTLPERWIDTHVHLSDLDEDGCPRLNFNQDLDAVFTQENLDLSLVASCDLKYIEPMVKTADAIHRGNKFIHSVARANPGRIYGACTVNPLFLRASLRSMETCFEKWGFVILGEMLQYIMGYAMDSDNVKELVRQAVVYDVPVQVHISTSNRNGEDQLLDLLKLAAAIPEAKYILAHAVGLPDTPPIVDRYLDLVAKHCGPWPDNFWIEIRDFNSPGVKSVIDRVPSTRILAGTDWTTRVGPPFQPYGSLFDSTANNAYVLDIPTIHDFLEAADATGEMIAQIAFSNADELLGILPSRVPS